MRQTKHITLYEDGQELRFFIKQMPATELERWCIRAMGLLARGGFELPGTDDMSGLSEILRDQGTKGLLRILGHLDFEDIAPLLDALLGCCHHISGPNSMTQLTPDIVDGIISEMPNLRALRLEALSLNLGFSKPEGKDAGASRAGLRQVPGQNG